MQDIVVNQNLNSVLENPQEFDNLTGFFKLLIKIDERNKLQKKNQADDRHSDINTTEIQSKK